MRTFRQHYEVNELLKTHFGDWTFEDGLLFLKHNYVPESNITFNTSHQISQYYSPLELICIQTKNDYEQPYNEAELSTMLKMRFNLRIKIASFDFVRCIRF
jgi:hypothetical protein